MVRPEPTPHSPSWSCPRAGRSACPTGPSLVSPPRPGLGGREATELRALPGDPDAISGENWCRQSWNNKSRDDCHDKEEHLDLLTAMLEGARHVPSLVVLVVGLRLIKEDSVLKINGGNVKQKQD